MEPSSKQLKLPNEPLPESLYAHDNNNTKNDMQQDRTSSLASRTNDNDDNNNEEPSLVSPPLPRLRNTSDDQKGPHGQSSSSSSSSGGAGWWKWWCLFRAPAAWVLASFLWSTCVLSSSHQGPRKKMKRHLKKKRKKQTPKKIHSPYYYQKQSSHQEHAQRWNAAQGTRSTAASPHVLGSSGRRTTPNRMFRLSQTTQHAKAVLRMGDIRTSSTTTTTAWPTTPKEAEEERQDADDPPRGLSGSNRCPLEAWRAGTNHHFSFCVFVRFAVCSMWSFVWYSVLVSHTRVCVFWFLIASFCSCIGVCVCVCVTLFSLVVILYNRKLLGPWSSRPSRRRLVGPLCLVVVVVVG